MAEGSDLLKALSKAVGVESPAAAYDIEMGHIKRFAEAIGDSNPLFTNDVQARRTSFGGIVAPPTFLRTCGSQPPPLDNYAAVPYKRILDGGSDWDYFDPVRPGDRITVTSRYSNFAERPGRLGPMLFVSSETTYKNQFGQVVAVQKSTRIMY